MMNLASPVQSFSPTEAVVDAVADRADVEPTELPPLYEAIDPDALDALGDPDGQSQSDLRITFPYGGYRVTVTGDGAVHVDESEPPRRSEP